MIHSLLTKEELDRLSLVIAEAEKTTSGELKLVIARRSLPHSKLAPLLWLGLSLLSMIVLWFEQGRLSFAPTQIYLVPGLLLLSAIIAWPLSMWPTFERLFVSPREMSMASHVRAELEFHREGLSQTVDRTGILLFLSVFDRQAIVLADKGIAQRLPESTWNKVVETMLRGAQTKSWEKHLSEAILLCGRLLTEQFPIQPGDVNEISNAVILKD